MAYRINQPVKALPSAGWGLIGYATCSGTGAVISNLKVGGCIQNVTLDTANHIYRAILWPQQGPYTAAATCSYATNASMMSWVATSATAFAPSSVGWQGIGINPRTAIDPPLVMMSVFGPTRSQNRQKKTPNYGGVNGPIDVIGMATFGTDAGTITRLRRAGVIQGIIYTGVSTFDILLSPQCQFYSAAGSITSDGSNASFITFQNSVKTPYRIQGQIVGYNPTTGRNAGVVQVIIFGPRPANLRGTLAGQPLGVIGAATWAMPTTTSVSNVKTYGCVKDVVAQGSALSGVVLWPVPKLFTFMAHNSDDAAVPGFMAWNANSGSIYSVPSVLSLSPTGVNPNGARTAGACMITIFGPLNPTFA